MVKLIPISKEYRENWGVVFAPKETDVAERREWDTYGAYGIGYPGWCVPVDMRRNV
jgi:hypothetical protein